MLPLVGRLVTVWLVAVPRLPDWKYWLPPEVLPASISYAVESGACVPGEELAAAGQGRARSRRAHGGDLAAAAKRRVLILGVCPRAVHVVPPGDIDGAAVGGKVAWP